MNTKSEKQERNVARRSEEETAGPSGKCGTRSIWHAIRRGSLPAVKYYYEQDHSIIHQHNQNNVDLTPLHYASEDGHLEIVEFLISKGAKVDARDSDNATPLMEAAYKGRSNVVKLLLANGARINSQDADLDTPLHWAIDGNRLDVVKLLIQGGADFFLKNKWNNNPLDFAKFLGDKHTIVNYLSNFYKY